MGWSADPPFVSAPIEPETTETQEVQSLERQAVLLEQSLGAIKKRIEDISSSSEETGK